MFKLAFSFIFLFFLFFVSEASEETLYSYKSKKLDDRKISEKAFDYIYLWIYRIADRNYFNRKYFKEGLFKVGRGIFILHLKCIKDYSGYFFLEVPKVKYISKAKYRYRYIPIGMVDKDICSKNGEIYTFRVFEEMKDKLFDVKNNRECYLSYLKVCINGRKNLCKALDEASFTCVKMKR